MRPLKGIVVVDLSQFLAGPSASLRMADLGATVIKIERPITGDIARKMYIADVNIGGDNVLFQTVNRNKLSVAADLKDPQDLARVRELLASADVMIQNFRPGVIDRLGLSYEAVAKLNPRIVYGSVSGYGTGGPWSDQPGQDLLAQARSGVMWLNGDEGSAPRPCGLSVADLATGAHLLQGILACLVRRGTTGRGGLVEVSLLESMCDLQFEQITIHLNDGHRPPPRAKIGNGNCYLAAPYGVYRTLDGYLALAMTHLPTLGELIGVPNLDVFDTSDACFQRRDEVMALIASRLAQQSTSHWLSILEPADVWCARVLTWSELRTEPSFCALEMVQSVPSSGGGTFETTRCPIRIDGERMLNVRPAPRIGEHNEGILLSAIGHEWPHQTQRPNE